MANHQARATDASRPREPESVYDLASIRLPVLEGTALRLFASVLESRIGGSLLLGSLLEAGGVTRLRGLRPDDAPLLSPTCPPAPAGASAAPNTERADAPRAETGGPFAGIADYAEAYRTGRTDPVRVAERLLGELEADRLHPKPLCAFIALDADDLLRQARESAERIGTGRSLGSLDGVPVAIKDEVDMVPFPTTVGTTFLGAAPATEDATTVARLRAAGALLVGKANMHEIGINPTGHNIHYGHCRNPYNPEYETGGSSSGPATAVAAGYCPVALGADGGGSIRVPAAHCGLVGLKPTYGRVSEIGAAPLCWSVAHLGPIGANVADVAAAYSLMAGPDDGDPHTLGQPAVTLEGWDDTDLSGVRIGVFEPWNRHATEAVVAAADRAVAILEAAGAEIVPIVIPGLDAIRIAHAVTILSETAAALSRFSEHYRRLAPATRINLHLGRSFTAADYLQAQRIRAAGMRTFAEVFTRVDAILTPTTAVTAPRIPANGLPHGISDLSMVTEIMRYAIPGNLLGFPALSVPAGYDPDGLPIGVQLMGRHWEEHVLLRLGSAIERSVERHRPMRFVDLLS